MNPQTLGWFYLFVGVIVLVGDVYDQHDRYRTNYKESVMMAILWPVMCFIAAMILIDKRVQ